MKKRTKIIIVAVMIVLLGVTGYLNIALNNSVDDTPVSSTVTTSYFAAYRQDRETQRDQMLLYYEAIASSETASAEEIASATSAKEALIAQMDTELKVEGLIKGLGFDDCVIAIAPTKVTIMIDSATMTDVQNAQIVEIAESYLGLGLENIDVIPVI